MENIDDINYEDYNNVLSKMTLQEELLLDKFHFDNGETRKIGDVDSIPYRIIEDKLTGEFFKVTNDNKVIKAIDDKYITVEDFNLFLDKRFDKIFGTTITKKKKYRVFLTIDPDQGSEGGMFYTIKEIEVMATDKEDALKQWEEVFGKPYYYYPTAKEIK